MQENSSKDELDKQIIQIVNEKKPENTRQLVDLLREKSQWSAQEIINRISYLQEKGKIHLVSQPVPPPKSFIHYLRSAYAYWYWTTITVTLATTLIVFIVPEDDFPLVYARYVLGAIFILWLPGYAFIKALFPKTHPPKPTTYIARIGQNLDPIERTALSIGMSLALVPLVGLLLNYTPFGIRLTPITLSLTALTIIFATTALLRENQNHKKQAPTQT